ncbi:MAG: hypothetical protein AAF902_16920 [Chloroflexota bacterium]
MSLNIWEYKTCECKAISDKTDKRAWQMGDIVWVIDIDGDEFPRDEGLQKLGNKGWEMIGTQLMQTTDWFSNSNSMASYSAFPKSLYIFKRPI